MRGPHLQRLRIDEADEMLLAVLDAAHGQPMDRAGVQAQTVISSTHQHPDGTMTAVLQRAAARGWPVYQWCYRDTLEPHGWLAILQVLSPLFDPGFSDHSYGVRPGRSALHAVGPARDYISRGHRWVVDLD